MPPSILHDPLAQLANEKLHLNLSKETLREIADSFRLVEARLPPGRLGKTDRPACRQAVLLERHLRRTGQQRIDWKLLASAVNVKPAALQSLQHVIEPYVQKHQRLQSKKASNPRSSLGVKRPALSDVTQPVRSLRARPDSVLLASHQIDSSTRLTTLALRLGLQPACADQANKLWTRILTKIPTTLSAHERRGWLYEAQRYGPAYQAAALYFCARKMEHVDLGTIANAGHDFTQMEVKHVWPHLQAMALSIGEEERVPRASKVPKKSKKSKSQPETPDLPLEPSVSEAADPPGFDVEVWKKQVLSEACQHVKELHSNESLSDVHALALAAEAVLRKHKLLAP